MITTFRLRRRSWLAALLPALVLLAAWTQAAERGPKTKPSPKANLKGKTFYLWGAFDLDGEPHTEPEELQYVKGLLREYGADVAREVTKEVDFVVIGRKPARPAQPDEGASMIEREVYRARLRAWENSEQELRLARKRAKELSLKVLQHDRFLKLIGADPSYFAPKAIALRRLEAGIGQLGLSDAPLKDVLQYVQDLTRLNMIVDWPELTASGAGPDKTVTADLKDVPASKALSRILQAAGKGKVRFVVDSAGILLISTKAGLARLLPRRPEQWLAGKKPTEADKTVIRKLNQRIPRLKLADIPLATVLEFLREVTKLDRQRKWPGQARAAGADLKAAVTLSVANVPAGRCLELVLAQHGLEFIIRRGAVVIRRRAAAKNMPRAKQKGARPLPAE